MALRRRYHFLPASLEPYMNLRAQIQSLSAGVPLRGWSGHLAFETSSGETNVASSAAMARTN
eukprot:8029288-Ditylum_brightwellii.AAC.1